jgi:phosphate transport system permease protein
MHLGFHIYDVGFQSPNVEAARPLVYATAFLLVLIVAALNLSAVALRNHLREKYKALES